MCFLEKYSYLSDWIALIVGLPSIIYTLNKYLREKSPRLNFHVALKDVYQEKADITKEELEKAIQEAEKGISNFKAMENSLYLKNNDEIVKYLEQSKEMYEAHLKSKGELVKLYSTISFEIFPNLPSEEYKINSIGFEYVTMSLLDRFLCLIRMKEERRGWALLPNDLQNMFSNLKTTQTDPIIVHYRISEDFIKKYLNKRLVRIYVLDSIGRSWNVPNKQIKKLLKKND
jgi:hypothetical protein